MESVFTVLVSVGGSVLLFMIAKPWLDERLRASVKHDYDLRFEKARSELQAEIDQATESRRRLNRSMDAMASTATNSFLATQQAALERRLEAVESLWGDLLRLRKQIPTAVFTQDLLLPEEYQQFFTKSDLRSLVESHDLRSWITDAVADAEIDRARPFVSDYLFSIAFIFRMIVGRVTFLLNNGFEKGHIPDWGEDRPIVDTLTHVLTEKELEQFRSFKAGRLLLVLDSLDNKFIGHARKLISGEEAADFGAELSRKIQELSRNRSLSI